MSISTAASSGSICSCPKAAAEDDEVVAVRPVVEPSRRVVLHEIGGTRSGGAAAHRAFLDVAAVDETHAEGAGDADVADRVNERNTGNL